MAVGYPNLIPQYPRKVWQPRSIQEAWQLKQRFEDQAVLVSGGTLLRTQWESGAAAMPPHLISLEFLPELKRIDAHSDGVHIGPAVTLAACLRDSRTPALLKEACRNIAAPSIRSIGTLGGNVMSAVGDTLPALLAADARFVWFDGQYRIAQSAADWVRQRRADPLTKESRLLIEVIVSEEAAADHQVYRFYEKLGRREAFCPSVVTIAGELHTAADGTIQDVRLAAGSAAATAVRLTEAEAQLAGQRLGAELLQQIHPLIMKQFDGGSDAFASGGYRRQAAANLITAALWNQISGNNSGNSSGKIR